MAQKPLLSIALLVSNRWDTIQKCLDSLTPIRESISCELIILDTGCEKKLRDLLESYADKIASFEWCKDFSKARNVTLDMAEGEWYLYLDDDEWFTETEELIDFFQSGTYKNFGRADYIQRNYLDSDGVQFSDSWVCRMSKRVPELHFESKIHEFLSPSVGERAYLHAVVDHYGYVYKTEEDKLNHFHRNYSLLQEMEVAEPLELRWRLQILQEFRTVDRYQDMISYGMQSMEHLEKTFNPLENQKAWENQVLGVYYASIILGYEGQKDYKNALLWCQKLEKDKRVMELSRAFGALYTAHSFFHVENYQGAILACEKFLEWDEYFKAHGEQFVVESHLPILSTTFDEIKYKEIYSLMVCSALKLKDATYLGKYLHKIGWKDANAYVYEEIADVLIEAMCTMGYHKAFHKALKVIRNHKGLNQYFEEKIKDWEERGMDVSTIAHMSKFGVRSFTQNQLLEIIEALISVNQVIGSLDKAKNNAELGTILGEAQSVAISLGTAIENELGLGTYAVSLLEEYCELLWSRPDGYVNRLEELLKTVKKEVTEFPIKKVVVFLPYDPEKWCHMEKAWEKALSEELTDEYVIPIPYFVKDQEGNFVDGIYKGNDFPQEVFVEDWQKLDLQSLRPDVIYLQGHYDNSRKDISVHPNYYVEILENYAENIQFL